MKPPTTVLYLCRKRKGGKKSSYDCCVVIYIWDWGDINNKETHHPPVLQSSRDIWKRLITTHSSSKACMWLECQTSKPKWDRGICLCNSLCIMPEETVEIPTMYSLIKIYCVLERWCHGSYGGWLNDRCLFNWFSVSHLPVFYFIIPVVHVFHGWTVNNG